MSRRSRSFGAALSIVATTALAGALSTASGSPAPPSSTSSRFVEPVSVSTACGTDAHRQAACNVIRGFFRDVNSRRFTVACGFLGVKLRSQTQGLTCEQFVRLGEAMPWGIVDARTTRHGIVVTISLGQTELDHIRMRRQQAFVGLEGGHLRILGTRLIA
jgi:hypothetical protein